MRKFQKITKGAVVALGLAVVGSSIMPAMASEAADLDSSVVVEEEVTEEVIYDEANIVRSKTTIQVTKDNFPDEQFRKYLLDQYDPDGDNVIVVEEVTEIDLSTEKTETTNINEPYTGYAVSDLTGLELLTSVGGIRLDSQPIKRLDLRNIPSIGFIQTRNCVEYLDFRNRAYDKNYPDAYRHNLDLDYDYLKEAYLDDANGSFELHTKCTNGVIDMSKFKGLSKDRITDKNYNKDADKIVVDLNDISIVDKDKKKFIYMAGFRGFTSVTGAENKIFFFIENFDCDVRYQTHAQSYGWQGIVHDGTMSGTSGESKRLESIKIDIPLIEGLGVQYTTHCQSYGWLPWSSNGEMNGTEGEAKRLEAIKIQLTGENKDKYDIYYRVHAQSYGWLGWAKNGEEAGTAGYAKRLEGIQIVLLPKGSTAPGANYKGVEGSATNKAYYSKDNTVPTVSGSDTVNVTYRTHVQSYGWQGWKYNGAMSGTSGKAKRLEGIEIRLTNTPYLGNVVYTTHVQSYGWQDDPDDLARNDWKNDGAMSGTSGEAKRLEAICIDLTGDMAEHYDIYYRVHAQTYGWLGWAKNGEKAGTAGYAKRLEGIQVMLVKKGELPPANYEGITSVRQEAYIKK